LISLDYEVKKVNVWETVPKPWSSTRDKYSETFHAYKYEGYSFRNNNDYHVEWSYIFRFQPFPSSWILQINILNMFSKSHQVWYPEICSCKSCEVTTRIVTRIQLEAMCIQVFQRYCPPLHCRNHPKLWQHPRPRGCQHSNIADICYATLFLYEVVWLK